MKKILLISASILFCNNLFALNIGDKLMNCEKNSDGTFDNCVAVTGALEAIPLVKNRNDVVLNYNINYNYTCSDNITQYIGIKSNSGSPILFKYDENNLQIASDGKFSIVDLNPKKTFAAQFVRDCNLHIKSIYADLSAETVKNLVKDACYMGILNTTVSQSQIVISLAQSLINNYGTMPIKILKGQLESLEFSLNSIVTNQNNPKIMAHVQNIVGQKNPATNEFPVGTLGYILNHSHTWGNGSISLKNNLNILYSNISAVMANVSDTSLGLIQGIYDNGIQIADEEKFTSADLPASNLKYQYALSRSEDTSKLIAPVCN